MINFFKYYIYKQQIKKMSGIYVCTPAKVASSMFLYSLKNHYNVTHGHSLLKLKETLKKKK